MPDLQKQTSASQQRQPSGEHEDQQQSPTRQDSGAAVSQNRRDPGYWQPLGFSLSPNDVMRMSPFALMRRLSQEFDRAFTTQTSGDSGFWTPAIEVKQNPGNYTICAELPGIDPKNVQIDIEQDAIVLRGERESNFDDGRGGFRVSERSYGSFYRTIPLPQGADPNQANARFHNGVLEITVPVREQEAAQRRQIPIELASGESKAVDAPESSGGAESSRSRNTNTKPEGGSAA